MADVTHLGRQFLGRFHEMTPKEFSKQPNIYWHGTVNSMIAPHDDWFHVGTMRAAAQALSDNLLSRVDENLDPLHDRFYSSHPVTLIKRARENPGGWILPRGSVHNLDDDDYDYIHESIHDKESLNRVREDNYVYVSRPNLVPGFVVGRTLPHIYSDEGAHNLIHGEELANPKDVEPDLPPHLSNSVNIRYRNDSEDPGSVSVAIPKRSNFMTHEDFIIQARAQKKQIPEHVYKAYGGRIPGQGRLF